MNKFTLTIIPFKDDWKQKEGPLDFKMRNDYLFRAFLQCDNESLKALIASLLYVDVSEITSAEITNPIILGASADDKEIRMDIHVILNKQQPIDIEMQTYNRAGWKERSVLYACRGYDSLKHGDLYKDHPGFWQVAFCDYTLFKEYPAFNASYMLTSTDDRHYIYSEKIKLTNIDMTKIDLATDNDINYGLVNWAKLFMAETWEDLKMLAEKDKTIERAVSSAWQMTEEEIIRERMRNREEGEMMWQSMQKELEEYQKQSAEYQKQSAADQKRIEESERLISEKDALLTEANRVNSEKDALIRELTEKLKSAGLNL